MNLTLEKVIPAAPEIPRTAPGVLRVSAETFAFARSEQPSDDGGADEPRRAGPASVIRLAIRP